MVRKLLSRPLDFDSIPGDFAENNKHLFLLCADILTHKYSIKNKRKTNYMILLTYHFHDYIHKKDFSKIN